MEHELSHLSFFLQAGGSAATLEEDLQADVAKEQMWQLIVSEQLTLSRSSGHSKFPSQLHRQLSLPRVSCSFAFSLL